MTRKVCLISMLALTLVVVCRADSDWSSTRETNDARVVYRWKRIDHLGASPSCDIVLAGLTRVNVDATVTYDTPSDAGLTRRTNFALMENGQGLDNIFTCDQVVDVVVNRISR